MRAVVQRVTEAEVQVDNERVGAIGHGLLILLGVGGEDRAADVEYMVDKLCNLRVFADDEGKMNRSVMDSDGEILLVSQFTLYGDCRKGRRPSFSQAAGASEAEKLYEEVAKGLSERGLVVQTGRFGADMKVQLVNDGPVTLLLESSGLF